MNAKERDYLNEVQVYLAEIHRLNPVGLPPMSLSDTTGYLGHAALAAGSLKSAISSLYYKDYRRARIHLDQAGEFLKHAHTPTGRNANAHSPS